MNPEKSKWLMRTSQYCEMGLRSKTLIAGYSSEYNFSSYNACRTEKPSVTHFLREHLLDKLKFLRYYHYHGDCPCRRIKTISPFLTRHLMVHGKITIDHILASRWKYFLVVCTSQGSLPATYGNRWAALVPMEAKGYHTQTNDVAQKKKHWCFTLQS